MVTALRPRSPLGAGIQSPSRLGRASSPTTGTRRDKTNGETARHEQHVLIVALVLLGTGYTSARLGKAPLKNAMIRNLVIGLLTMAVIYAVGQVFAI